MRAFVGIDLEPAWRDALAAGCEVVRALVPAWEDQKWVPSENLHITLKFLGDLPDDASETLPADLAQALEGVRGFRMNPVTLFEPVPNRRSTNMLWTTLDDADGHCADLAERVESVSERYGVLPDTRDFRAHVTLCRTRRPRSFTVAEEASSAALQVLTSHGVEPVMSVHAVTLLKSTLTRTHAHYDRLSVLRLAD